MGTTFLIELAAGCLLFVAACRTDHVDWSYFRRMTWIALGLVLVILVSGWIGHAAWSSPQPGNVARTLLWFITACLILWPRLRETQPQRLHTAQRLFPLFVAVLLIVFAVMVSQVGVDRSIALRDRVSEVVTLTLAACILGGTTATMLLGHAYLTLTAMPIDPLRRLTRLLILSVVVRAAWACTAIFAARDMLATPPADPMWLWLMLSVRAGVGLLGLGVLSYMVWDCVRRRSTQSATGILYIAMIFAFFGELAAAELARTYRLWV